MLPTTKLRYNEWVRPILCNAEILWMTANNDICMCHDKSIHINSFEESIRKKYSTLYFPLQMLLETNNNLYSLKLIANLSVVLMC